MKQNTNSINIDACTHCATCLSVCPVYDITLNERFSPRGKISLINAVNKNLISPFDKDLQETISACLMCERCSKICPADINISYHIRNFRQKYLKNRYPSTELFELSKKLLPFDKLSKFIGKKIYNLEYIKSNSDIFQLNKIKKQRQGEKILLFTGCVHKYLLRDVISYIKNFFFEASIIIPVDQTCCGMPFWSGGKGELSKIIKKNIDTFFKHSPDIILTGCESCAFMIKNFWPDYFDYNSAYYKKALDFSSKTFEFVDFISRKHSFKPSENLLNQLDGKILYHTPCHKTSNSAEPVLRDLFGEKIKFAPDKCCGFGGLFSIKHPSFSKGIFNNKIDFEILNDIQYVVTNCSGGQNQFKKLIKNFNKTIRVLHPAQIFE